MSRERLERCFHLCAQRAWRLACAMLGDAHGAADCVQQAFAVAARKPASVPADDPWPWFSTVLFHEIRNHRRKRRPGAMPEDFDMPDPRHDPAAKAAQAETAGELRLALDTLPEPERDAITLTYIGGLTHVQAAQTLDMPAKTLSSHVSRGLERLRRRLNHKEEALLSGLAALPLLTPPGGWEGTLAAWQGALGSALPGTVAVVGGTIMAKKAMVAAGLVLALLVGYGAGAVIEYQPPPQPVAQAPIDPASEQRAAQNSLLSLTGNGDSSGALDPGITRPVPSAERDFGAWLVTVGATLPTPGPGRIHGHVTGPDAEPLPGVIVTLAVLFPEEGGGMTRSERLKIAELNNSRATLEDKARAEVRRLAFLESGRYSTRTSAEGTYEFAGLGLYEFSIKAEKPGYAFRVWGAPNEGRRVKPDAQIDFTARAVCALELDVRLPDGQAPDVAQVVNTSNSRFDYLATWFPENPVVPLELGSMTLQVYAGQLEEFLSEPIPFTATAEPQRLTVRLKPSAGILCTVKLPPGVRASDIPSQQYQVCLQVNPPAAEPTARPQGRGLWVKSVYGPRFEANYPHQLPGRYRVFLLSDNRVEDWEDVEMDAESVAVTLEPSAPDPKEYIVVRVFNPSGELATGAIVRAVRIGGNMDAGSCRVIPKPDGSHWVERNAPPTEEQRRWNYAIQINLANYGATYVTHPWDGAGELDVKLPALANLTINLPGALSHPWRAHVHPELQQFISPAQSHGMSPLRGLAGDKVVYGPMPPGKYRFALKFQANATGSTVEEFSIDALDLDLQPGENTRTIELPVMHTLTLLISDTKAVPELNIERPDGRNRRWVAPESISARTQVDGMMRGEWILRFGSKAMRVNISSDTIVQLDLRPMDCVVIGQLKAGGKIEALGLRSGDKVIRVDGKENESASNVQDQMRATYKQDATIWTVQRGGLVLDVSFSGIELLKILQTPGDEREYLRDRHSLRD